MSSFTQCVFMVNKQNVNYVASKKNAFPFKQIKSLTFTKLMASL